MATAHAKSVLTLYRNALQHSKSWCIETDLFRLQALDIRKRFEANQHERNFLKSKKLLEDGQDEFNRLKHPDKYKPCVALDGTKWERNIPPPPEVCKMTPEEESWYNDKSNWA